MADGKSKVAEPPSNRHISEVIKKRGKKNTRQFEMMKYYFAITAVTVAIVAAVVVVFLYPERKSTEIPINDSTSISDINAVSVSFKAAPARMFDGWNFLDVKKHLGKTFWTRATQKMQTCKSGTAKVPKQFDARTQWSYCYKNYQVRSSGRCSSSWAISAVSALSDRFCIFDDNYAGLQLSPQDVLSCDGSSNGCNGGYVDSVYSNLISEGVVREDCFPYVGDTLKTSCDNKCKDTEPLKAAGYCAVEGEGEMMREIYDNGPIVALAAVYDDFLVYSIGVYRPLSTANRMVDTDRKAILQAVKVFGWGEEGGYSYWLIENCWGSSWGQGGFGKILRGSSGVLVNSLGYAVAPMAERRKEKPQAAADREAQRNMHIKKDNTEKPDKMDKKGGKSDDMGKHDNFKSSQDFDDDALFQDIEIEF